MLGRCLRVCAALLTFVVLPVHAEQVLKMGDYVVHYNAFASSFLSADVARQYGITRSKYQGVLNIAVQRASDGKDVAVTANVHGRVKNDIAQVVDLDFREIKDGDAIYYIASFSHSDKEKLDFDIAIQPEGKGQAQSLTFSQDFYAD